MAESTSGNKKLISFGELDASHIYEYLVMYWHLPPSPQRFGGCARCQRIGKRLERMLGDKEVKRVRRAVKNHGGPWW